MARETDYLLMESGNDRVAQSGAILIEYGMILVVVLLVSFALVQLIGGQVLGMFNGMLNAFG